MTIITQQVLTLLGEEEEEVVFPTYKKAEFSELWHYEITVITTIFGTFVQMKCCCVYEHSVTL